LSIRGRGAYGSGMVLDPALAPLSRWTDAVLLVVRLIAGVMMLYYGWPKIRDPRKNAKDFGAGRLSRLTSSPGGTRP
jgi:uncharacterized membrane protein YphA (DoxX/SURF4 family)